MAKDSEGPQINIITTTEAEIEHTKVPASGGKGGAGTGATDAPSSGTSTGDPASSGETGPDKGSDNSIDTGPPTGGPHGNSQDPNAPKKPDTPADPNAPKVPNAPVVPDAPKDPNAPKNPNAPVVPDAPQPHSQENQAAAEAAAGDIPKTPGGGAKSAAASLGSKAAGKVGDEAGERTAEAVQAAELAAKLTAKISAQNYLGAAKDIIANRKLLTKLLWQAIKNQLMALLGWPTRIVLLIILFIVLITFGCQAEQAATGANGKSYPIPAGADDPNVKSVSASKTTPAITGQNTPVSSIYNVNLIDEDAQYIADGKVDARLIQLMKTLAGMHLQLNFSHIISGYSDMPDEKESGAGNPDAQITANVSAHKDGLAADLAAIDFVYNTQEKGMCCEHCLQYDKVWYGDSGSGGENDSIVPVADNGEPDIDTVQSEIEQAADSTQQQLDQIKEQINQVQPKTPEDQQKVDSAQQNIGDRQAQINAIKEQIKQLTEQLQITQEKLAQLEQILADGQDKLSPTQLEIIEKAIEVLRKLIRQYTYILKTLADILVSLSNSLNATLINFGQLDPVNPDTTELQNQIDAINEDLAGIEGISNIGFIDKLEIPDQIDVDLPNDINEYTKDINETIDKITGDLENPVPPIPGVPGGLDTDVETLGQDVTGISGMMGPNELLRLRCEAVGPIMTPNTTYNAQPAKAVPIKVSWQDEKPDAQYIDTTIDDMTDRADSRIYYSVYQPESRRKINEVVSQILQYPYDQGNKFYYRASQIITFSHDRDVKPFWDILTNLYGLPRRSNLGLFAMPEAWGQVHMAY